MRINPFSLRGMKQERRAGIASEVLQIALELTPMQAQRVRDLLMELYKGTEEPTIKELYEIVMQEAEREQYKEMKLQLRYIANKLSQAFEVFGTEPEEFWKNYDDTCNVVELEGLTDAEKTLVTLTLVQRITEEFTEGRGKKRLNIALDDAYKAIQNYYDKETPIAKIVREGRKYGFAMVISTQMLKDMPEAIVSNTALKFIHTYHDPFNIERVYSMLGMSEFEKSILYRMPTGSCLLFDLNAIQKGKVSPAYVQVDKVTDKEREALRERTKQVPVEEVKEKKVTKRSLYDMTIKKDIPDVSVYRFLIALKETNMDVTSANKLLKDRGWVRSTSTLYGSTTRPSLIERAVSGKYATSEGVFYEKTLDILDPDRMVNAQGIYKGGEVHRQLMERTIAMIQSRGNYAFVPTEKDSFDVGEIEPDRKIKGWWNYKEIKVYEIQTDAEKGHIRRCIEKGTRYKAELRIVVNDKKVEDAVRELTNGNTECINLNN